MALPDFASLLKQSMGLDVASIGSSAIDRAVEERQSICGLKDPSAYWGLARASEAELQELIEAVVVPETWFFRDPEAFALLGRLVREEWLLAREEGVLRVLSLPSSTGEEPYSIAMALVDAGVPAGRFRIHAFDISARALARAGRAVYGKNSFRGNDLSFRTRHFEATPSGYRLNDSIRQQVDFERGNLFAADLLPGVEIYDVIFCRNLLIYFDRSTQDRAIAVLERALTSKGVLFVAPSETGLLLSHDFISTKVPLAFAFRKPGVVTREPTQNAAAVPARRPFAGQSMTPRAAVRHGKGARDVVPVAPRAPRPQTEPQSDLDVARRFADEGHFVEAARCCEDSLRLSGPSAEVFYLLGVVRDASGNPSEASACYRKALYLDPNHHQVLIHLALLMEKLGQKSDAQLLRQRARRVEQRSTHV
jgi:chemotaxis protein methyltransferase WspC